MNKANFSRRGFLARAAAGLTIGAGLPAWFAREVLAAREEAGEPAQRPAPNDRIQVGGIGVSSYGLSLLLTAQSTAGTQVMAVCDVDARHRAAAATRLGGACAQYDDYRKLLDRRDLDAVIIATPDHWHALPSIHAMQVGKDVYCEKPLGLTVAEGRAMVNTTRRVNRVFQTGSQYRSDPRFRLACELVRNGRLGPIQTVETWVGSNPRGGPFTPMPVPEGLDWDFWLGQAPRVDYVKQRCHYDFRWWYEYSGGTLTDLGSHYNDLAQWALGYDGTGPIDIEAQGDEPSREPNSFNCPPNFRITYTYAEGPRLVCTSQGPENAGAAQGGGGRLGGIRFHGQRGQWLQVYRGRIEASEKQLVEEPLGRDAVRLPASTSHMANFLQSIRTRGRPISDVEVGHHSATVCHVGNIALRLRRRLRWDPKSEQFVGEPDANRLLHREMRRPWKLEG
jgi:predicted dehydrogenase